MIKGDANKFLSTLSLRRATRQAKQTCRAKLYFYPRSPCGERLRQHSKPDGGRIFLSTLSLRRATVAYSHIAACKCDFYPRSPCGERRTHLARIAAADNFYPRSPCGERRAMGITIKANGVFLSTLSLRRATNSGTQADPAKSISIHALLAESDPQRMRCLSMRNRRFLSTLSLRRATRH